MGSLWCYVTPILGAVVADQYLGKYKTLIIFACVYIVGLLILVLTSLPTSLENGAGMGGFVAAILIIGIGTGGIKSNVAPLIADQYQRKKMAIKTIVKTGERVIIDPAVTIQRIYLIFYCCINIGALSLLATPYMERDIKFGPINRITFGFLVASMSMLYAGVLQHFIYETGPCSGHPLECPAAVDADGVAHGNNIHIAIQTPAYMLIGVSEIFASVTGLEYAYMKAPPTMKSFVQAMYLLTNAFGYAISEAFIPLVGDPEIMWLFVGLCVGSTVVGVIFWIVYHQYDALEDQNNA